MAKKKVTYGKVNLDADEFDPKNTRVLISIRLPGDLLADLKKRAEQEGKGYQTIMVDILRDHLRGEESVEARLAKLERALLGKKAS